MDWGAIIAAVVAGVGGIAAGAGGVWRYLTKRLDAAHAEIKRLNELRVSGAEARSAEQVALITRYERIVGASTEVMRQATLTMEAKSDR